MPMRRMAIAMAGLRTSFSPGSSNRLLVAEAVAGIPERMPSVKNWMTALREWSP
jgi:hypothetical protein